MPRGRERDREQKGDFLTRKGQKQAGREMEVVRGRAGVCSQLTNAVPQSSTGLQLRVHTMTPFHMFRLLESKFSRGMFVSGLRFHRKTHSECLIQTQRPRLIYRKDRNS